MDLEEHSLDPVIERKCAECGAPLTEAEIKASMESDSPFLCTVHATEQVQLSEEDEPAG